MSVCLAEAWWTTRWQMMMKPVFTPSPERVARTWQHAHFYSLPHPRLSSSGQYDGKCGQSQDKLCDVRCKDFCPFFLNSFRACTWQR